MSKRKKAPGVKPRWDVSEANLKRYIDSQIAICRCNRSGWEVGAKQIDIEDVKEDVLQKLRVDFFGSRKD